MKPWIPIALLLGGFVVFIYLMSLVGNHISG